MNLRKYLILLVASALFVSCGKDKDENGNGNGNGPTTEEKIVGSWQGVEYQENFYENDQKDTLNSFSTSIAHQQYDFKAEGTVEVFQGNDLIEELDWSLNTDNNLELDGLEYEIINLDENDFEARHRSEINASTTFEVIFKWRK